MILFALRIPDHYAECYPGMTEMDDAIDDSDEEADYSKMDLVSFEVIKFRECVRNLDLRVHPGELWVSKGYVPKICGFVQ